MNQYEFIATIANNDCCILELGACMAPAFIPGRRFVCVGDKADGIQRKDAVFIRGDLTSVSLDERFDILICHDLLNHSNDPSGFLDILSRLMAHGASAFFSIPENPSFSIPFDSEVTRGLHGDQVDFLLRERFGNFRKTKLGGADESVLALCQQPRAVRPSQQVSIIMPLFNRCEFTLNALTAIANKTNTKISFEIVLVDNASTDNTSSLLKSLQGDVFIWKNYENLGFAKACNQGALISSGRYLVFLNNDTKVHPGWLDALVDELDSHPNTGVVGGRLLYPNNTIQHAGVAIGRDQIPFHIHNRSSKNHPLVTERREYSIVTGACMAVRRKEFFDLGMFDEGFVNGHEDIDICFRYGKAGKKIIYRPDCVVTHYESVSEGRMDNRPKNLARTFHKWRYRLLQDDFQFGFRRDAVKPCEKPLRFAIKISPYSRKVLNWGDTYYAECLAKSLCKRGHFCRIDYLNEWGRRDLDIDVVIHLKGLNTCHLKPYNINIMWMLNHPELHSDQELSQYDAILVASNIWAAVLKERLDIPVFPLLQATDPDHFFREPDQEKVFDVAFIGNYGEKARLEMVHSIFKNNPSHSVAIWGAGWRGIVPEKAFKGFFLRWEYLPRVYAKSRIVLNQHQKTMRDYGFLNNRHFDALASGALVLSDKVKGMDEIFPVPCYDTPGNAGLKIREILSNIEYYQARQQDLREKVLASCTFDIRAKEILEIISSLEPKNERIVKARKSAFEYRKPGGPLVSILMSTRNRRRFLKTAVASIQNQTYGNWELIVARDGGEPVADLLDTFQDSRIQLIQFEKNKGKPSAINAAFRASKGKYIAYLDDDDIWYPDHLDRLLFALSNVQGIRMVYSDAYNVQLEAQSGGTYRETERELKYDLQVTFFELIQINQIQGISVMNDRHLFERVGGMDKFLRVLIDYDLWRRYAAITYPYHVSRITAEHYLRTGETDAGGHQITGLFDSDPVKYMANRVKIMNKPLPLPRIAQYHDELARARKIAILLYFNAQAMEALKQGKLPTVRRFLSYMEKISDVDPILFNRAKNLLEIHEKNQGMMAS